MEIFKYILNVPCEHGKSHEVVVAVEKVFDSMRQDSDFVLSAETEGVEIIEDENNPPEWWEMENGYDLKKEK